MLAIIICVVVFALLYVLSTSGRVGHPGLEQIRRHAYTHRGLHGDGAPENSLKAFSRARDAGYGVELDVHLLQDGGLAVIHDSKLLRTTGRDGNVELLTKDQLKEYFLEGTGETIPSLEQVLSLFDGKVPVIVELKTRGNNVDGLCRKACEIMDTYGGIYCMESFDPRCVYWLKKNRPDIIRGQLSENYLASNNSVLPWLLKLALSHQVFNFITRPDFVAYRYTDRKTISNALCRRIWKMQGVTWTLKSQQEYETAIAEGWIPIFEGFLP